MGRAPNPGAPQRVSAHVVPKAPSTFRKDEVDEEEKTTIESGWEEEASTTVEQGEVAERIRALGVEPPRRTVTGVTSTNAHMLDEPTVDDQRANLGLSLITPMLQARLVITGGNDSGNELSVSPGKSYTIGRAVDNDIVLTDIAVSRKHFDLRHEGGTWVLVDRGSGNGTLVNGNVEDQPFMLANGDTIEIGNTMFRFEIPNGIQRAHGSVDGSVDIAQDEGSIDVRLGSGHDVEEEEEPSTVAGKPVRPDEMTPAQIPAPHQHAQIPHALLPQQVTQPMRAKTMPPPAPVSPPRPRNASTAPPISYPPQPQINHGIPSLHQHHARQSGVGPAAPTMLGDAMGIPYKGMLPTTIPGQGPPPRAQSASQPHYAYPQSSDQHSQLPHHMLVVGNHQRDAPPTGLVAPTPYSGAMQMQPQPYVPPQISRRTKMILAGAGLTLFAAIATIAVIKGSNTHAKAPLDAGPVEPVKPPPTQGKTIQPIDPEPSKPKVVTPPKKDPPKVTAKVDPPKVDPPKVDPPKVDPPKVDPPKTIAKVDPPKVDPPKVDPPKVDPPKTIAKVDPPKKDPPKVVAKDPPPKKDPPKVIAKDPPPKKDPPKVVAKDPPPKKDKRVGADVGGVRAKAEELFAAKRFAEAITALKGAAAGAGEDDAKALKSTAAIYDQFARAYNVGMAPGTPPKDAFAALKKAKNYDPMGVFADEVKGRMVAIAGRAAAAYMGAKNYPAARELANFAEANGAGGSTIAAIKSSLESTAGDLYKEAQAEMATDPDAAKAKLRLIQQMVDSKSPWFQKAGSAISASR